MCRAAADPATADPAPTADALLRRAERALLLRHHHEAVAASARCLNALACPAAATADAGGPSEDARGAPLLPALLPLPAGARARSVAPMALLQQAVVELGRPELAAEALHASYLETAVAPFEVVWLGVQALGRAARPEQAATLASEWLGAAPPPPDLTPARRQQLLRLLLTRVLEPAAARAFLEGDAAALAPALELQQLRDALEPPPPPKPTPAADADADADADAALARELRQKIDAEAAADAAADAAVAEPPPPAPVPSVDVAMAEAPSAALARRWRPALEQLGAQWAAALRRGAAALDGRLAVLAPDVRRALEVAAALIAALTALRVVAGSSAARARRRRVLSLLAYAVLPFVAALRQLVASGAGLSRTLT